MGGEVVLNAKSSLKPIAFPSAIFFSLFPHLHLYITSVVKVNIVTSVNEISPRCILKTHIQLLLYLVL
jgi:hypothetical protein